MKIRDGPAAVTGDNPARMSLFALVNGKAQGRMNRESENLPEKNSLVPRQRGGCLWSYLGTEGISRINYELVRDFCCLCSRFPGS